MSYSRWSRNLWRKEDYKKGFKVACIIFVGISMILYLIMKTHPSKNSFNFDMPSGWFDFDDDQGALYIRNNHEIFCNKCDFESIKIFFRNQFCQNENLQSMNVYIVGGNKGQLTKDILQVCNNLLLNVFEPHPELSEKLEEMNLESGFSQKVRIHKYGISEEETYLTFFRK